MRAQPLPIGASMEKKQSTAAETKADIREWLQGKTVEDLEVVEQAGRLLFPEVLRRRTPKGYEEEKVRLRVPRPLEITQARVEAIAMASKYKIDREKDSDLFEEYETICRLSKAIREYAEPHGQAYTAEQLLSGYDSVCLQDLWQRVDVYQKMIDPRITDVDADDVINAARGIAHTMSLSPLAAIAGSELDSCIITMACMLVNCLTQRLILQSPEILAPAP